MDNFSLSLKNLYRLITVRDYPIFSTGILSLKNRKGMTLVSFWQEILIPEWKSGPNGRKLWKENGRSRYLSDFCNGKSSFPNYKEYRDEILEALDMDSFLSQLHQCMSFLYSHQYDSVTFRKKSGYLIQLFQEKSTLSQEDFDFLTGVFRAGSQPELPADFADAWLLSMLILYAMLKISDEEDGGYALLQILRRYGTDMVWRYDRKISEIKLPLRYRADEMWNVPENTALFFGRERELFELTEIYEGSRKVFITGIGGIGKTELLRQFLHRYLLTKKSLQIVAVQYDGGLRESLVRSFLPASGERLEESFFECLYLMKEALQNGLILLIDNANVRAEDLPSWEILAQLGCPVIATSREKPPEGYEQMELSGLPSEAAQLLLRRHYGRNLSEEEKEGLETLSREDALRHPLTIRLVARAANCNHWSVTQIWKSLSGELSDIVWRDDRVMLHLGTFYRELYRTGDISEEERWWVSLLALLPYEQLPMAELYRLSDAQISKTDFYAVLRGLDAKGWLEQKGSMISMHPLIAECLCENRIDGNQFERLQRRAKTILEDSLMTGRERQPINPETQDLSRYLISIYKRSGVPAKALLRECTMLGLRFLLGNGLCDARESTLTVEILGRSLDLDFSARLNGYYALIYGRDSSNHSLMIRALDEFMKAAADEKIEELDLVEFGGNLIYQMAVWRSDPAEIEKVKDMVQGSIYRPVAKLDFFCHCFAAAFELQDYERAIEYASEAMQLYESMKPEELDYQIRESVRALFYKQVSLDRALQDMRAAREHLRKGNLLDTANPGVMAEYLQKIAECEIARGENRLEDAIRKYGEAAEKMQRFCGENDIDVLTLLAEKALVQNEAGQTQEAIRVYEDCIERCKKYHPGTGRLLIWMNNLGVAHLRARQPEEAIRILKEVLQLSENVEPIMRAEPSCNLSKAYRQLGDTGKEIHCLKEAFPVFRAVYGEEHTKTKYVAERLEELS